MSNHIPSLIPTIVLLGRTNAGKSSLINALTNQEISIVSNIAGTTTDEVVKRMELLDVGPINLIDTAGLNDVSELKKERLTKTKKAIKRADLLLYIVSVEDIELDEYNSLDGNKMLIFNKIDLLDENKLSKLKNEYPDAFFTSSIKKETITLLKSELTKRLIVKETGLLDDLKLNSNKIVHVIPIDKEAPKGRLILPQMQLLRECLDKGLISIVLDETNLANYLNSNDDIALIVTDSQVFNRVSEINEKRFPITSYSILQANQKGDLNSFLSGIDALKTKQINNILIMESCSHNTSHEDIGQVKIPRMLRELVNNQFDYDFYMSHDFPDDLEKYDLIVHCGSCMLSKEIMLKRIKFAHEKNVPITNYGLLIAHYFGILDETVEIFK